MTTARMFILTGHAVRMRVVDAVLKAPDGMTVVIAHAKRNSEQNARLHAMVSDIARQVDFFGQRRDAETVKRLLVDAFARVKKDLGEPLAGYGRMLPSLDGSGCVQLGLQTRRFSKALMSEFIDYLHAWGVENDVYWSEKITVPYWVQDRGAE